MDPLDRPLTELIGHHLDIATRCKCARVVVFSPESLVEKLRPSVTLRSAAARLICHERPTLLVSRDYPTSEGRDMRVNPPALPDWVVGLLER